MAPICYSICSVKFRWPVTDWMPIIKWKIQSVIGHLNFSSNKLTAVIEIWVNNMYHACFLQLTTETVKCRIIYNKNFECLLLISLLSFMILFLASVFCWFCHWIIGPRFELCLWNGLHGKIHWQSKVRRPQFPYVFFLFTSCYSILFYACKRKN